MNVILNATQGEIGSKVTQFLPLLIPGSVRVIGAIFIFIAGIWLSGKSEYFAGKLLSRVRHFDQMLRDFFANLVRYFVLTVTGLTVLSQFGVQTTSLVAVIGAASLAIGLALQGTLSNLAAGIMLLIFRPFRLGQQIQIAGNAGTTKELTLFWTEIITAENVQIIVPNSQVWGQPIKNLSTYASPPATVEVRFPIAEPALASAKRKIQDIVQAAPGVAKTPLPTVLADRSPTDNSLQIVVKFSPSGADGDATKSEIIENVVSALGNPAPSA
jgi:small conductance mechanosensitive channel